MGMPQEYRIQRYSEDWTDNRFPREMPVVSAGTNTRNTADLSIGAPTPIVLVTYRQIHPLEHQLLDKVASPDTKNACASLFYSCAFMILLKIASAASCRPGLQVFCAFTLRMLAFA